MSEPPVLARTRAELAAARADLVAARGGASVAAVLTMGALHDGHVALARRARALVGDDGVLVLTVFVNPLQFGAGEDLDRYPRTLEADLDLAGRSGVDIVFAPPAAEVYRGGQPQVTVHPGPLGDRLEGAVRPGHFAGVLTVVAKLLLLVRPAVTVFGEKDYQQLVLVRRMAHDLDLGVEVVGEPTVREPDGLALSSRNAYLSSDGRHVALALSAALEAGAAAGPLGPQAVRAAAQAVLDAAGGLDLDYLELTDPDLGPAPDAGPARLLAAARVGPTRLIDNLPVTLATREA
jgi:pantoate--beta-alanine ligase